MKMVIEVEGGVVSSVCCDEDFDVIIYDLDVERASSDEVGKTSDGREAVVGRWEGKGNSEAELEFDHGVYEIEMGPSLEEVIEYLDNEARCKRGREEKILNVAIAALKREVEG